MARTMKQRRTAGWLGALLVLTAGGAIVAPAAEDAHPGSYFQTGFAMRSDFMPSGLPFGLPSAQIARGDGDAASSAEGSRRMSRLRAVGASLILPGWGQRLVGHPRRAKAFMMTDLAIVTGYITFQVQGRVRRGDYVDYAEQFAAVGDADDKEDDYYWNLERYPSTDDYMDDVARTARAIYGDDVAAREEYIAANTPIESEIWEWESEAHREAFRDQRRASRHSFKWAGNMFGAAVINRIISAVEVALTSGGPSSDKVLYVAPGPEGTNYVGLSWILD